MDAHLLCVAQTTKMLRNLAAWLKEAETFAEEKGFEVDRWLEMRLAPDQYGLARNVQAACDGAKFLAARLADVEAPSHPDDEKTMAELHERIAATIAFIEGVKRFDGAEERKIVLPFLPEGTWVTGQEYAVSFAVPNFYFHVTTAYAILRDKGVALGKRAFIGAMDVKT